MVIEIKELEKIQKDIEELKVLIHQLLNNAIVPEFVTAEKAAEKLETTTQTLYNLSKKGLFPKYKFGDRTVYYKLSEIYAAFKKHQNGRKV